MKTSELIDLALDWAVAEAKGDVRLQYDSREGLIISNILGWIPYRPSRAWQQGGPIIESEGITVSKEDGGWSAYFRDKLFEEDGSDHWSVGETPLIAAMRCFVASRLGDEVAVPEELLP